MRLFSNIVRFGIRPAEPVTRGNTTVIPQALTLVVRLPFGGFVWNRPVAVLVERNGRKDRILILDPTRFAQLGVLIFTLTASRLLRGTRNKQSKQR